MRVWPARPGSGGERVYQEAYPESGAAPVFDANGVMPSDHRLVLTTFIVKYSPLPISKH